MLIGSSTTTVSNTSCMSDSRNKSRLRTAACLLRVVGIASYIIIISPASPLITVMEKGVSFDRGTFLLTTRSFSGREGVNDEAHYRRATAVWPAQSGQTALSERNTLASGTPPGPTGSARRSGISFIASRNVDCCCRINVNR